MGHNDCEVPRTLLHSWIHDLQASDNDSIPDFFDGLYNEFQDALHTDSTSALDCGPGVLPFTFIAEFMHRTCVLPFQTQGLDEDTLKADLALRIAEESVMVSPSRHCSLPPSNP